MHGGARKYFFLYATLAKQSFLGLSQNGVKHVRVLKVFWPGPGGFYTPRRDIRQTCHEKGSSYRAQKKSASVSMMVSTTAAGVASRKLSVGLPLACFFCPFWHGSPLAGWRLLLWYFISFFSADSRLSSMVVKVWCSAAKKWTKNRACLTADFRANLLPRRLLSSKFAPAMVYLSTKILAMTVAASPSPPAMTVSAFSLPAMTSIPSTQLSWAALQKSPPAGTVEDTSL